ncbi:hypothetical protein [Nonomuraea jabiensis]|uniref:Uncharacterized protein n=2 Tax=Nonomuraea TaxID=83681 RepID=A0A7W9LH23_9ACTN|nr:hypothetical protein [Nonomuraea jabiensis]MBB5783551.1 hypothetical protein [Nonomuraea jabiensis]
MRRNDWPMIWAGALIALAVIALAGYVVTRLDTAEPSVIAGMFAGLAALLAGVPPIIRAIRGRR